MDPLSYHYEADDVDPDGHDLPSLRARFLLENLPDGGVLLEVGCGGGKNLRTIAKYRSDVILLGCDIIVPGREDPGFDFRRVDPDQMDLPYADSSVDTVLLYDVLEHVKDPKKVATEIARVIKPDGLLIAFIPFEGERISWYTLFRHFLGQDLYAVTKDHIQAFTHREVMDMIGQDFHVQKRQYAYHPFGQLMDATFFALVKIPRFHHLYWTESPFHNASDHEHSLVGRCFGAVLQSAHAVAWAESKLLGRFRFFSTCVLLTARRNAGAAG